MAPNGPSVRSGNHSSRRDVSNQRRRGRKARRAAPAGRGGAFGLVSWRRSSAYRRFSGCFLLFLPVAWTRPSCLGCSQRLSWFPPYQVPAASQVRLTSHGVPSGACSLRNLRRPRGIQVGLRGSLVRRTLLVLGSPLPNPLCALRISSLPAASGKGWALFSLPLRYSGKLEWLPRQSVCHPPRGAVFRVTPTLRCWLSWLSKLTCLGDKTSRIK